MNKKFTYIPPYVQYEGHMFSRDTENMKEQKYIINIELLARDCGRDIQATVEMLGETYASVVDYTMQSSRLGTWYGRLLEADKELGTYEGSKDDMLRVIKLSDDLKQDVKAYQAACDKQAELLYNYYFSNKISANTKFLQVYNHNFSKDNSGYITGKEGYLHVYYVLAGAIGLEIVLMTPLKSGGIDWLTLAVVSRARYLYTNMAYYVAIGHGAMYILTKITCSGHVMDLGTDTQDHRGR